MKLPLSPRQPCRLPLEEPRLCRGCRQNEHVNGLSRCSKIVAHSPAMRALLERVAAVCRTASPVVVTGETGTGKEVLARLLHANSERESGPFVALNVAALPPDLLESELFGHVRGAFTGAHSATEGLFGEADGGTLLLDEIGEMPLPLQAKLLRVLQEGEVRRVGDARPRRVDVRVVCATHRNLRDDVRAGRFREDLYYRIKVFELRLPPLRERREDIAPLASSFAARLGRPGLRLAPAVLSLLERYRWPGNVRELGNAIEHAIGLSRGAEIEHGHLPDDLFSPDTPPLARPPTSPRPALRPLEDVEREHVLSVIDACGGNLTEAAAILRIGRTTIWRKLRSYSLSSLAAPAALLALRPRLCCWRHGGCCCRVRYEHADSG